MIRLGKSCQGAIQAKASHPGMLSQKVTQVDILILTCL